MVRVSGNGRSHPSLLGKIQKSSLSLRGTLKVQSNALFFTTMKLLAFVNVELNLKSIKKIGF